MNLAFESRISASIFLGRLISAGTFLGIQNNERIRDSFRVSLDGIFGGLNHGSGIFWVSLKPFRFFSIISVK